MTQERWLLTVIAALVTDATWLFLLLGFMGFTAGLDGAPLPWPVVFGLPMLAALTKLVMRSRVDPAGSFALFEPFIGIVVIYWAVSVSRIDNAANAGFAWPLDLIAGSFDARGLYATTIVLLAAAYLWMRGVRRVSEPEPGNALLRSFRTGLIVFAGIIFFEEAGDLDLGTRAMLLPFFVASLMGLAVSHSVGRLGAGTGWLGFAAASVAAILATGLVVAILGSIVIRQSADILSTGWIAMMTAFVDQVSAFIDGLALEGTRAGSDAGAGTSGALIVDPPGSAGPDESSVRIIVALVEPLILVAGTAGFVWLCHRLLSAPEKLWPEALIDLASVERESLEAEQALSLSELFQRVLPAWIRQPPGERPAGVPALGDGIGEAYMLYFRLLEVARGRGVKLVPSQTPFERASQLREVLPAAPVQEITQRFVAACYGREPSSATAIARLGGALENAAKEADSERPR